MMSSNPKRHPGIETKILPDGHAVLMSEKTNWAYTLNPLAAIVWEFCDGTNSLSDIVQHIKGMKEEIQLPDDLEHEVAEVVDDLTESDVLVTV